MPSLFTRRFGIDKYSIGHSNNQEMSISEIKNVLKNLVHISFFHTFTGTKSRWFLTRCNFHALQKVALQ